MDPQLPPSWVEAVTAAIVKAQEGVGGWLVAEPGRPAAIQTWRATRDLERRPRLLTAGVEAYYLEHWRKVEFHELVDRARFARTIAEAAEE